MSGSLKGLRIIEFGGIGPGPFGATMLADHGAEVIRIDRPGDTFAPFDPRDTLSRNRTSLILDLSKDEERRLALDLCETADAIIEGFRPGVMERLGFGPDALLAANPRLVYARMTGWGQDGPLANQVGHDINYLALSGVLSTLVDGEGMPRPPQNMLADYAGGGMILAFGVIAALLAVQRGASGQVVDIAMVEGAAMIGAFSRSMRDLGLHPNAAGHNLLDGGAPFYRCYRCGDGRFVAVGAIEPRFYQALMSVLGLIDEPLFAAQLDQSQWTEQALSLEQVFATRTRDEWAKLAQDTEACISPVLDPDEATQHAHAIARSSFVEVGGTKQPRPVPRFADTPAAMPRPAPERGSDTKAFTGR